MQEGLFEPRAVVALKHASPQSPSSWDGGFKRDLILRKHTPEVHHATLPIHAPPSWSPGPTGWANAEH